MNNKGFVNAKKVSGVLAAVAFVLGFVFLDQGVTGNAIIYDATKPAINPVSIVGLLCVLCSAIFAFYSIRK